MVREHLVQGGIDWQTVTYISDGEASHFKNRYQLFEFGTNTNELQLKCLFRATGHGKGSCDGIGGMGKHFASTHNLRSMDTLIQNCATFIGEVDR